VPLRSNHHDEYDIETGHIGPLRSYLYFFDPGGAPIPGAWLAADSTDEVLEIAKGFEIDPARWAEVEQAMDARGNMPLAALEALQASN